jgi:porphobilinogen deaminase
MGGGCQSPVAAYARFKNEELFLEALSFATGPVRRAQASSSPDKAAKLGNQLASELKP